MSNVRITVSIDPDLKEKLDLFASQEGLDRSAAFEAILRQHFERPKEPSQPPPPQAPEPVTPTPQLPPPPVGLPHGLEERIQKLERDSNMTRQYINLLYPMHKGMLERSVAYHAYIYGTYLEVALYPPPPWWDKERMQAFKTAPSPSQKPSLARSRPEPKSDRIHNEDPTPPQADSSEPL